MNFELSDADGMPSVWMFLNGFERNSCRIKDRVKAESHSLLTIIVAKRHEPNKSHLFIAGTELIQTCEWVYEIREADRTTHATPNVPRCYTRLIVAVTEADSVWSCAAIIEATSDWAWENKKPSLMSGDAWRLASISHSCCRRKRSRPRRVVAQSYDVAGMWDVGWRTEWRPPPVPVELSFFGFKEFLLSL